ncbi:MAG: FAD-dependent oxidoreductase [Candidatus Omnitrophica bacterium]|nr:FAD-dependent oxidoreductase [Candidatus Omnitrophota bacterium]MBU1929234.1 FAD-dependent oxidoreductase [Candidatus Omnitrophota bacterium]MBU2222247.1 FAD-dependent oxidoreductase [Candidatus Omnitrophota bacterium]
MTEKFDYIIVGAGLCGLTLAKELSQKNKKVLVLEQGGFIKKFGNLIYAASIYDKFTLSKSRQGVIILRSFGVGGTSIVSCGNAVEFPEEVIKRIGIDFRGELDAAKKECRQTTKHPIGKASMKIMDSANQLGYDMQLMSKLGLEKCVSCGNCILGCDHQAKWTAAEYLKDINNQNVFIITGFKVKKVISSAGKAVGIEGKNNAFSSQKYFADKIILSAGGIGTPIILQKSGVEEAGKNLFVDLFTDIYGINKEFNQAKEISMSVVCTKFHKEEGFILSPFIDSSIGLLACVDVKYAGYALKLNSLMGLMNKINDDNVGRVYPNGTVDKTPTQNDWQKLKKGNKIATEILIKSGVNPKSIFITLPRGAHPGGTAAIGKVVNTSLETKIKNLYVCDCSVLPEAPGFPPILILVAISKWFAKNILEK